MAKQTMPGLHTFEYNLSDPVEREKFALDITQQFPELNILVNNAGTQRFWYLNECSAKPNDWKAYQEEILINLEAPIHLITLFLGHLEKRDNAAIINVTSGLLSCHLPPYLSTVLLKQDFILSPSP